MKIYNSTISIELKSNGDMRDITRDVENAVRESKINNGIANIFVIGSTGSVTTIEYEPGVIADLKRAIQRLAPPDIPYEHDRAWHDGNGHSHVQAALMGPSLSVPIKNGKLILGTWQQIIVINHDVRPRVRKVEITIIGN